VSAPTVPHPAARRPANPPGRGVGPLARPPAGNISDPSGRAAGPQTAIEPAALQSLPATASRAVALASRLSGPEVVSWRFGRPRAARCHVCSEQHAVSETGRLLVAHGAPRCFGTRAPVQLVRALQALQARRSGGLRRG
jgi:hypothetical protein